MSQTPELAQEVGDNDVSDQEVGIGMKVTFGGHPEK